MKNNFVFIFWLLFVFSASSQNTINYKLFDSLGKAYTSSLKNGNIEHLKNAKPPKDTWTYSRLLDYKNILENNSDGLIIGTFIEPSADNSYYGFNLFAYKRIDNKNFEYYFAAIINIDVSNDVYKVDRSYLFTEAVALDRWWSHVLWFYEGDTFKDIPENYVFPVCPPPPFKD